MADLCLNLLCATVAEERVLDALLANDNAGVFTSSPASAHGFAHSALSTDEQVSGRSGATLVQVLVAEDRLGALRNTVRLSTECPEWSFGTGALMRNLAERGLL